jgi:hypothetical protein
MPIPGDEVIEWGPQASSCDAERALSHARRDFHRAENSCRAGTITSGQMAARHYSAEARAERQEVRAAIRMLRHMLSTA